MHFQRGRQSAIGVGPWRLPTCPAESPSSVSRPAVTNFSPLTQMRPPTCQILTGDLETALLVRPTMCLPSGGRLVTHQRPLRPTPVPGQGLSANTDLSTTLPWTSTPASLVSVEWLHSPSSPSPAPDNFAVCRLAGSFLSRPAGRGTPRIYPGGPRLVCFFQFFLFSQGFSIHHRFTCRAVETFAPWRPKRLHTSSPRRSSALTSTNDTPACPRTSTNARERPSRPPTSSWSRSRRYPSSSRSSPPPGTVFIDISKGSSRRLRGFLGIASAGY